MPSPSLILASGSPRRLRLLTLAGFQVDDVRPPNVPEVRDPSEEPCGYARRLSVDKAKAATAEDAWILAADTIVHRSDRIYEKPANDDDARRMLRELSGAWHEVTTAWCLRWSGPGPAPTAEEFVQAHQTSRVRFRDLTAIEIERYVETGEGRDKAGAYAIQGDGASLILQVEGSTTNVVGLPLDGVIPALTQAGLSRMES